MPSDDLHQGPVVDPEDRPLASRSRVRGRRSLLARLLPVMIVVVALGGFAGLVGYYYMAEGPNGAAPLIKADLQPFKVKPDNPGGMDVPDQDKAIYDRMGRVDQSSVPPPNTERLLPLPETPVSRPAAAVAPPPAAAPPNPSAAASPPSAPATPNTASPNAPGPNAANPNVGGPVLGAPQSPRSTTLATAPPGGAPAPAATPPAPAAAPTPPKSAAPAAAPAAKPAAPASTQTAAVAPRSAPAPTAGGGPLLRAAIASLRTEADAKREWERQRRLYPAALAGVTPSYASVDLGGKGVYWRIYIGPAESSAAARARCAGLKEKKVDCFVARP